LNDSFQREDYVLRWPRELFRARLARLINGRLNGSIRTNWNDLVEHLLADAFESDQPTQDFRDAIQASQTVDDPWANAAAPAPAPIDGGREFLVRMLRAADDFPHQIPRRPYRSQRGRNTGDPAAGISLSTTATRFVNLIADLEHRGYFERTFQKDCVDDPANVDASALIKEEIGVAGLWPLSAEFIGADEDLFLDVLEVIGEFVAAPQSRSWHNWNECGWHHSDFNIALGRDIYYWNVNRLLSQTSLGLRLATSGEDRGRLVEAAGDARNDLVAQTIEGADEATRDPIQHAVAMFRKRGVTTEEKRSACVTLASVLELRRQLLQDHLYSRDEGALFQIANQFDLRHRSASQRGDYDPVFLDWVFWWYLGTIELTDRIVRRQSEQRAAPAPDPTVPVSERLT
jgi:hypothetical protein